MHLRHAPTQLQITYIKGEDIRQNLRFKLKNTVTIRYSSVAVDMVNSNWGSCCLTRLPAKLIAWHEVLQ